MPKEEVENVIKEFPGAYCMGYAAANGYCIVWPTQEAPIVATGRSPTKAWKAAAKLIKGKNKKAIEKLKLKLIVAETKRGNYGPGF
jgi:hypothetical protein